MFLYYRIFGEDDIEYFCWARTLWFYACCIIMCSLGFSWSYLLFVQQSRRAGKYTNVSYPHILRERFSCMLQPYGRFCCGRGRSRRLIGRLRLWPSDPKATWTIAILRRMQMWISYWVRCECVRWRRWCASDGKQERELGRFVIWPGVIYTRMRLGIGYGSLLNIDSFQSVPI